MRCECASTIAALALFLSGLSTRLAATEPFDQPKARLDPNSRLSHEQRLATLKQGKIDLYFVGDSITRRWRATDYPQFLENWNRNFRGWNAANFGWGGDTVQNILWRMQHGEIDGVEPRVIVLMAGTNNIGSKPASEGDITGIARGLRVLLDTLREKAPQATIILMGITPRNDHPQPTAIMPSINRINQNISQYADGKSIRFLNINDKLADETGRLIDGMTVDRLHLSLKGYQVWADALTPVLSELLGPPAENDESPPPTGDPSAAKKPGPQKTTD
jgi:lysophospholipase L1-like esterase